MRTTNLLMTAAVVALSLTACNSNDERANVVDMSNTPIHFTTSVNSLTANSRAGYETGTLTSGSFGLFLTTEGTTDDTRFNTSNRKFTYTAGAWTAPADATQLLWKDNSATVSYTAYLPYNAEAAEASETAKTAYPLSVAADQSNADAIKVADFLWVKGTTTGTVSATSGIALAFDHKMSKLTINLTKGTELTGEVTFEKVELTSCCGLTTTINLTDGIVAATPTDARTSSITTLETTPESAYECILVPQTIGTLKVTISATVGGASKTYVYTATSANTFQSGKAYTLPLTVGYDKVTAGTFTAESWGDNIEGGDLETE